MIPKQLLHTCGFIMLCYKKEHDFAIPTLVQAKGNDSCSRAPLTSLQTLTVSKLREWVNKPLFFPRLSNKAFSLTILAKTPSHFLLKTCLL